jgi:3-methylcrotonyl-CoA carboxylase alpha subunit
VLLHFKTDEGLIDVDVSRDGKDWRLVIEGHEVPLQAFREQAGSWLVDTHQGRRRLWVAARGDQRLVFCDGRVHVLELPDADHPEEDNFEIAAGGLFAAMPGKVVKVLVAAGETVTPGQPIIILESMKMETELAAAVGGRVETVHVTDGQLVGQGDALVDIASDPEGDPT